RALRPRVELARIDLNLAFGIEFNFRPIHWTRRRPFEVDPFDIVAATMAGTFELVLARIPIGGASQVSATRVDYKQPLCIAHYPDAVLVLKLRVYTNTEI